MKKSLNTIIAEIHPQIKEFLQKVKKNNYAIDYSIAVDLRIFARKKYELLFSAIQNLLENSPELWLEDVILSSQKCQKFFLDLAEVSEVFLRYSAKDFAYRLSAPAGEKAELSIDPSVDCPEFTTSLIFAIQAGIKKWNLDSEATVKIMTNLFLRKFTDLERTAYFLNRSKDPGIFLGNIRLSHFSYEDEENFTEALIGSPKNDYLAFVTTSILFLYKSRNLREEICRHLQDTYKAIKNPITKKWIKLIISTLSSLEEKVKDYLNRPGEKIREKLENLKKISKEVTANFSLSDKRIRHVDGDSARKTLKIVEEVLDRIFTSTVIQCSKGRRIKIGFSVERYDVESAAKSIAKAIEKLKGIAVSLRKEIEDNIKDYAGHEYSFLQTFKQNRLPEVVNNALKRDITSLLDVNVEEFLTEVEAKKFFKKKVISICQNGITGIFYPSAFEEDLKSFLADVIDTVFYVKSDIEKFVRNICSDLLWNITLLRDEFSWERYKKPESIILDFAGIIGYTSVYRHIYRDMTVLGTFRDFNELVPDIMLNYEKDQENMLISTVKTKLEKYLSSEVKVLLFAIEVCDVIFRNTQFYEKFKEEVVKKLLNRIFYNFLFEPAEAQTVEEIMYFTAFYRILAFIFSTSYGFSRRSSEVYTHNSGVILYCKYPYDIYQMVLLSGLLAASGCTEKIKEVLDIEKVTAGRLYIPVDLCIRIGRYLHGNSESEVKNRKNPSLIPSRAKARKNSGKSNLTKRMTKEEYVQLALFC